MNELAVRENTLENLPPRFSPPKGSGSIHLDALRGVAAFLVLLAHWRQAFFQDFETSAHYGFLVSIANAATGLSHQAVMIFFVLSGYLVGGSVLRAVKEGNWSWRDYLLARLTRLYIVLLPALVLGAGLDWIGLHFSGQGAIYGTSGRAGLIALNVGPSLTVRTFLANVFFLQNLPVPGNSGVFRTFGSNIPLWSLSFEFSYYIAFPFVVLALSHGKRWYLRLAYLALLVVWGWFVGRTVVIYSILWLLGAAIHSLPPFPTQRPWARRGALAVALAVMMLSFIGMRTGPPWAMDALFGECAAAFIWIAASRAAGPVPGWYARVAHGASKNSYTLYLVHLPFLVFLKAMLHVPLFRPSWQSLLIAFGLMALILAYVRVVYLLFEKHTDELRSWIKRRLNGRRRAVANVIPQTAN
jgi:peptidoglycan/LPS O-acetylase OafA/YrhL